jgi:hypothetical protein
MVATVSPVSDNYDESMSTLRYADQAKRIVNHAVVNEVLKSFTRVLCTFSLSVCLSIAR